jgi:hypothetical protein
MAFAWRARSVIFVDSLLPRMFVIAWQVSPDRSAPSPLPTVPVNIVKDWVDYVAVIGGVLGGLGAIGAVAIAVLALRAQERANKRALAAERRASRQDLYRDMLDYISSARNPRDENRINNRAQLLSDEKILPAWEEFRHAQTRQAEEAAAEKLERLIRQEANGEQQSQ